MRSLLTAGGRQAAHVKHGRVAAHKCLTFGQIPFVKAILIYAMRLTSELDSL